mmetsp:Transcript_10708/g.30167  ORF Transcript_10708/g.30167 Transcript_10708/m.30167 type:complete len:272 (+) Transcript_10708:117-932(+)
MSPWRNVSMSLSPGATGRDPPKSLFLRSRFLTCPSRRTSGYSRSLSARMFPLGSRHLTRLSKSSRHRGGTSCASLSSLKSVRLPYSLVSTSMRSLSRFPSLLSRTSPVFGSSHRANTSPSGATLWIPTLGSPLSYHMLPLGSRKYGLPLSSSNRASSAPPSVTRYLCPASSAYTLGGSSLGGRSLRSARDPPSTPQVARIIRLPRTLGGTGDLREEEEEDSCCCCWDDDAGPRGGTLGDHESFSEDVDGQDTDHRGGPRRRGGRGRPPTTR